MPVSIIDHLVVTAPSLNAGKIMLHEAFGVWPQAGGEHVRMGTHNLLLRLGPKAYLEVIAINPALPSPDGPRWFELDGEAQHRSPGLATWVARCDDIHIARDACDFRHGDIELVSRSNLQWSITIAQDGSLPFDGVAPTLIQWQTPEHPASRLDDRGCTLMRLQGFHPEAARISDLLTKIGFCGDFSITPHQYPHLIAQIQTPFGLRVLNTIVPIAN